MTKQSGSSQSAAHGTKNASNTLTAEELDRKFDAGEDISEYLDFSKARRPGREVQRVNVDFPVDLLREIDAEADRIGVTRQAFIKVRMADVLLRSGLAPVSFEDLDKVVVKKSQEKTPDREVRAAMKGRSKPPHQSRERSKGNVSGR